MILQKWSLKAENSAPQPPQEDTPIKSTLDKKTEISEFVSPRRHTGSSNNCESAEHGIRMNADVSAVDPLNEVHIPDALLANDEIIDAEITCYNDEENTSQRLQSLRQRKSIVTFLLAVLIRGSSKET